MEIEIIGSMKRGKKNEYVFNRLIKKNQRTN